MNTETTVVQPLPPLADTDANTLTNFIRTAIRVLENNGVYTVQTATGGYTYHFNRDHELTYIPENRGFTYMCGTKLSKQDVLRYYGGDALVQAYVDALPKAKTTTLAKGGKSRLLRKLHRLS